MPSELASAQIDKKYMGKAEFVAYLAGVFFYTMMTGMMDSYRNAFLVNVLQLENTQTALFNSLISIIPFVMNFFIAMYIDSHKVSKKGKFRPMITYATIPAALLLVATFVVPKGLSSTLTMAIILIVALGWSLATMFTGCINSLAMVLTPNMKERDTAISFRSISSAVGNSAPLVVVLVIGLLIKDEGTQYIIGASLCSAVGVITMLLAMKLTRERVVYSEKRKNPLVGYLDVLKNKYAWTIIVSEFLKNFRKISTYLGVFLAAALLGSTSKYLLFGLPTGIGTAVGMLVINFLLKKFNSKVLYIASGIYSVLINTGAFAIGYIYFKNGSSVLQIVFIIFLFLIGLQFGASNLLPSMFQADVLEHIELQTGKRLEASLPFVIGIGTMISGTIATTVAPLLLYGEGSIIGYIQPTDAIPNPVQSLNTKIMMLFFYTVFHGLMMFLAGVPFFFYKLTGKTKEDVHEAVMAKRAEMEEAGEANVDQIDEANA